VSVDETQSRDKKDEQDVKLFFVGALKGFDDNLFFPIAA
jgi:hypothetical protein